MPKNLLTDLDRWRSYNPPRTTPPGFIQNGEASIVPCPQCTQPTQKHKPRGARGVAFFLSCSFCQLTLSVPKPPRKPRKNSPKTEVYNHGQNRPTP